MTTITHRVAGNVDGTPFLVEVTAESVEKAERIARDTVVGGPVTVWAVVDAESTSAHIERLASWYWRERFAEGGTSTDEDGKLVVSDICRQIYDEMGVVAGNAVTRNRETLVRCGVPESVVKLTAGQGDVHLEADHVRWTSHSPVDGYQLDQLLDMNCVEAWSDGFRWVWHDDERLMVTYCEGDLSGQFFFTSEAFEAAYASAEEFYLNA